MRRQIFPFVFSKDSWVRHRSCSKNTKYDNMFFNLDTWTWYYQYNHWNKILFILLRLYCWYVWLTSICFDSWVWRRRYIFEQVTYYIRMLQLDVFFIISTWFITCKYNTNMFLGTKGDALWNIEFQRHS